MRIVTRGAPHRAVAFDETCGFAQTVSRTDDLELVFLPSAWSVIEEQHEISERFAGPVRERTSLVSFDRVRQAETGGLQVALHAHLDLPVRAETRRIYNGVPLPRLNVPTAGTMTSLAIDSFRNAAAEYRFNSGLA